MGAILAVNCGSSSVKASLYDVENMVLLLEFDCTLVVNGERTKDSKDSRTKRTKGTKRTEAATLDEAFELLFDKLEGNGYPKITAVGHRFVHGGSLYNKPTRIDDHVLGQLASLTELAPLHNQPSYEGIVLCMNKLKVPQTAIFDTGFFADMPEVAKAYALPKQLVDKYGLKRYGFHGISHEFLWCRLQEIQLCKRAITIHLGNGCSITATKEGVPQDTSMGFTPLEGLVMGTRSGDLDPAIVGFLSEKEGISAEDVVELLNHKSGLLGLSGVSNDMAILLSERAKSVEVKQAIDVFCYRVRKYIGAYQAVLGGAEALVFSGGIGENSPEIRAQITRKLIEIDPKANQQAVKLAPGECQAIHSRNATVPCYVIATDENRAIARYAVS